MNRLNIIDLEAGHYQPENGKIKLTCFVGDGWQQTAQVEIVRWSANDDLESLGVADCELGAHHSDQPNGFGAWYLIVEVPTDWMTKQQQIDLACMTSRRDR